MNYWYNLSKEYANTHNYLDELFRIYPFSNCLSQIDADLWREIDDAFTRHDNMKLIETLLKLPEVVVDDHYFMYLRRDPSAILRNLQTVNRLAGIIYEHGLAELYRRIAKPRPVFSQEGELFSNWIAKRELNAPLLPIDAFLSTNENAILIGTYDEKGKFAGDCLQYDGCKRLDLIARYNGRYVVGKAHYFESASDPKCERLKSDLEILKEECRADVVMILDGEVYLESNAQIWQIMENAEVSDKIILSALLLRDFLHQL